MNEEDLVFKVPKGWKTVATDYPLVSSGDASITRDEYKRGTYNMENVDGFIFWYNHNRIPVTALRIHDKVVMVDDPIHWIGMQRLAEASTGKVLVIGLGLGLVVHALVKNTDVTQIDIVEINHHVTLLHTENKLLPKDKRIHLFLGNGYEWEGDYDTVIIDILVSTNTPYEYVAAGFDEQLSPLGVWGFFKHKFPEAQVFLWGIKNEAINPAVKNVEKVSLNLTPEQIEGMTE